MLAPVAGVAAVAVVAVAGSVPAAAWTMPAPPALGKRVDAAQDALALAETLQV